MDFNIWTLKSKKLSSMTGRTKYYKLKFLMEKSNKSLEQIFKYLIVIGKYFAREEVRMKDRVWI